MSNLFKKSPLFKNSLVYMTTEVVNKAVPFLLLPILTHYLSPRDYGLVATYGAFIGIVAVFLHLSMVGAVNINFFKMSKEKLKIYIANVMFILFINLILMLIGIYFFQDILSIKTEIPSIWLFVGLIVTFSQFITLLNLGLWQVEQRPKPYGVYQISQMLVSIVIVLILVVGLGMGWEGQLIGQSIGTIVFALLSFLYLYKREYLKFNYENKYIKDALAFGIPLIPHVLSGWFRTGVDRIFLTMFISSSATGIYAVGYQFGMVVGIIATAFNQAFSPYLYKKLVNITNDEKYTLVKYTYIYFVAIFVFAALISAFMPWIITNFLDERYIAAKKFIPWVAFGFAFSGMYYMVVNYIFYEKKTYILSLITFFSGILHVLFSYTFIKVYGEMGVAYAMTLSSFIMFILVWVLSARVYSMPWGLKATD